MKGWTWKVIVVVCVLSFSANLLMAADPGKGDVAASGTGVLGVRAHDGPDPFGYEYWDSSEAGGPSFDFLDISGTGTALGPDDDGEVNSSIGFSFPFYGTNYTDLRVGNNGGLILATSGNVWASNSCPMPDAGADGPMIFVFWDDLDTETGDVYVQSFQVCPNTWAGTGACFVVQWDERPHYNGIGAVTLEAILYDNGHILFQYEDVDFGDGSYDNGAGATVGIQDYDQDANYFLEYSCNAANLADGMAVYWSTDGLPAQPPTPTPTPVAAAVPALGHRGMAVLVLLLTGVALLLIRRRSF